MLCRISRSRKHEIGEEILIDIEFLRNMGNELKRMSKDKRGRPYKYGDSLFKFLGFFYTFIRNYRILEGFCRGFQKLVTHFPVPDHSTIHRRFAKLSLEFKNVAINGNMLIVDSLYDSRLNFNLISRSGVKPLIKVHRNSITLSKDSTSRRKAVIEQRNKEWGRKSGYTN